MSPGFQTVVGRHGQESAPARQIVGFHGPPAREPSNIGIPIDRFSYVKVWLRDNGSTTELLRIAFIDRVVNTFKRSLD
jgi:hypothetical protein